VSKYILKEHKRLHDIKKNFLCEFPGCGKSYKTRVQKINHQKKHGSDLKRKIRVNLLRPKKYFCNLCKKIFAHKYSFKAHLISKHVIKSYECPFCKENFFIRKHRTLHLKMHSKRSIPAIKRKLEEIVNQIPQNSSNY
jgi:hypothetical protein